MSGLSKPCFGLVICKDFRRSDSTDGGAEAEAHNRSMGECSHVSNVGESFAQFLTPITSSDKLKLDGIGTDYS